MKGAMSGEVKSKEVIEDISTLLRKSFSNREKRT